MPSCIWWRHPAVLWARRLMWSAVFLGGLYILIGGVRLILVPPFVPAWVSGLAVLAGLLAMSTALPFLWVTTRSFQRWLSHLASGNGDQGQK